MSKQKRTPQQKLNYINLTVGTHVYRRLATLRGLIEDALDYETGRIETGQRPNRISLGRAVSEAVEGVMDAWAGRLARAKSKADAHAAKLAKHVPAV